MSAQLVKEGKITAEQRYKFSEFLSPLMNEHGEYRHPEHGPNGDGTDVKKLQEGLKDFKI